MLCSNSCSDANSTLSSETLVELISGTTFDSSTALDFEIASRPFSKAESSGDKLASLLISLVSAAIDSASFSGEIFIEVVSDEISSALVSREVSSWTFGETGIESESTSLDEIFSSGNSPLVSAGFAANIWEFSTVT